MRMVLFFICSFLVGCEKYEILKVDVLYLPYMDSCTDEHKWLYDYLYEIDKNVSIKVLYLSDFLPQQKHWDKMLEVRTLGMAHQRFQLAIDTYLLNCGPNASFDIGGGSLNSEEELRSFVVRRGGSKDTDIKVKLDPDRGLIVLYTEINGVRDQGINGVRVD